MVQRGNKAVLLGFMILILLAFAYVSVLRFNNSQMTGYSVFSDFIDKISGKNNEATVSTSPQISAQAISCGNGIVEPGEACDGNNLSGYTCAGNFAGYVGGTLTCRSDCKGFDVSQCVPGTVRTAVSCNYADVLAAYNLANNGDIVQIPSGTCTWSSTLIVSKSITLKGRDPIRQ